MFIIFFDENAASTSNSFHDDDSNLVQVIIGLVSYILDSINMRLCRVRRGALRLESGGASRLDPSNDLISNGRNEEVFSIRSLTFGSGPEVNFYVVSQWLSLPRVACSYAPRGTGHPAHLCTHAASGGLFVCSARRGASCSTPYHISSLRGCGVVLRDFEQHLCGLALTHAIPSGLYGSGLPCVTPGAVLGASSCHHVTEFDVMIWRET
ncbi:hypothetical protein GW17_00046238 [Ensete ventricosum]|nr:hypothetical protein GW17_00046238 [Ensete ventricosum]